MNSIKTVDRIISAKWIIPIVPQHTVYEDCSLIIHSSRVVAILPSVNLDQTYVSNDHLRLDQHILMPGLVNSHGHAAMTLMRGLADDLPLMTWLQDHIWPNESKWVSEAFVEDGTKLAIAEMIKGGTTCFSDMYFYPEAAAEMVRQTGIRAQIAFPILDFPTAWAANAEEYIHKGLKLHDDYRALDRINIVFGPHAPYTVSDEPLRQIGVLSEQLQSPIHIHVHETAHEVEQSLKQYGVRPLKRLYDLGVLTPLTQCVHMTQITQEDIDLLTLSGAKVIHCPESNLKLASGVCPITKLLQANISIGLGTDGAASNNDLDMFGELTTAALIAKLDSNDATAGNATTMLTLATMGGAMALGLEEQIGSLEPGKRADVIAIEAEHLSCTPSYNLLSTLVYNNRNINVTHSWVDGRLLLDNGILTTMNEESIKIRAKQWQAKIAGER